jgi:hypothetical protein
MSIYNKTWRNFANMNSMERVLGVGMQRRVSLDVISVVEQVPRAEIWLHT